MCVWRWVCIFCLSAGDLVPAHTPKPSSSNCCSTHWRGSQMGCRVGWGGIRVGTGSSRKDSRVTKTGIWLMWCAVIGNRVVRKPPLFNWFVWLGLKKPERVDKWAEGPQTSVKVESDSRRSPGCSNWVSILNLTYCRSVLLIIIFCNKWSAWVIARHRIWTMQKMSHFFLIHLRSLLHYSSLSPHTVLTSSSLFLFALYFKHTFSLFFFALFSSKTVCLRHGRKNVYIVQLSAEDNRAITPPCEPFTILLPCMKCWPASKLPDHLFPQVLTIAGASLLHML